MADETNYVHEEASKPSAGAFFSKRWVRITGISLAAAVALVGAFGAGVLAGERLGGNATFGGDDRGFNQQFGGNGQFQGGPQGGAGVMSGDVRGFGGPGGCPADDPDHCAGTDRGQHNFQLPQNGTNGGTTTSGTSSTTKNP